MKKAMSRVSGLLALLLIAAMMLTMVGCGGNPSDESYYSDDYYYDDDEIVTTTTTTTVANGDGGGLRDPGTTTQQNGGNTTTTTTTKVVSTDLKDVPAELKGTKIKMLIWWTEAGDDKDKAADFKNKTGIEVTYVSKTMDNYQTYLSSSVMSGQPPAIAAIVNEWYPQPITRGLMQPISNVEGWNFKDTNIYSTSLMDQFGYKGEHYGIALKGGTNCTFHVMFFNKKILQKCGVKTDPYTLWKQGNWNWDTCLEIAQKCTKPQDGLSGITNVGQYVWMLSAGQDFVKSTKAGLKNNIKASEVLNAWNWNWDLINTYKVVDTTFTGQTPFFQGKAAMLGAGSYMMQAEASRTNYVPQQMKDDWSVVPFPSPKGMSVAACDGTVWGFPKGVSGNKLQSAAWYLRYYLDDSNNANMRATFYPADKPECWEVMNWMWNQTIQSYNSVGVLTYGGEHTAYTIQYSLVDEADTKAKMKSNLDQWDAVLEANIKKIENELS